VQWKEQYSMAQSMWRHGDVLIAATQTIPEQAKKKTQPILAYGEVTGHTHRIEHASDAEVWEYQNELFLHVLVPTRVVHEEHHPIALPPGIYRVWQQREYTPQEIRTIRD
jgi:hypothetical protein